MNPNVLKVLTENPTLPVYAWVADEVCENDFGYGLGVATNAKVVEFVFFERNGITYPVAREDASELEDFLWDNRKLYLGIDDNPVGIDEGEAQDAEFNAKIGDYLNSLNWQKAVFVCVGTPDTAEVVQFPTYEEVKL